MDDLKEKTVRASDHLTEFLFLSVVFILPLAFSCFFWNFDVFGLFKTSIFRGFSSLVILSFLFNVLVKGRLRSIKNKGAVLFSFFLSLSFLLSTVFSVDPIVSFWGVYGKYQGFYTLISYIVLFLFLLVWLKGHGQIKRIIITTVISSLLVCVYGLIQLFGWDIAPWKEAAEDTGRIFSTMGQPNFLGHFLAMMIPLTVYYAFFEVGKASLRLPLLVLSILQLVCLFFTYSRAAWVALLLSGLLFLVLYLYLKKGRRAGSISVIVIFVLLASLVSVIAFEILPEPRTSDPLLKKKVLGLFDIDSGSIGSRTGYWKASIEEISEASFPRKVFGYGPDAISDVFFRRYESSWSISERLGRFPQRAHNSFLDNVLQFGFFGLAVWAIFALYIIRRILRYLKEKKGDRYYALVLALSFCLAVNFFNGLFSFSLVVNSVYFYLLLGLLFYCLDNDGEDRVWNISWPNWLRVVVVFLFLILFSTMVFYHDIRPLKADHHYMLSIKFDNKKDHFRSWYHMRQAVILDPDNKHYLYSFFSKSVENLKRMEAGDMRDEVAQAVSFLTDGFSTEYKDLRYSLSLAAAKSVLGYYGYIDKQEADLEYIKLMDRYSEVSAVYKYYGFFNIKIGEYLKAIDALENGIDLLPPLSELEQDTERKQAVVSELVDMYEGLVKAYENVGEQERADDYDRKKRSLIDDL